MKAPRPLQSPTRGKQTKPRPSLLSALCSPVQVRVGRGKTAGDNALEMRLVLLHDGYRNARSLRRRVPVRAGADGGKRDTAQLFFQRQTKTVAVAAFQQGCLATASSPPHRANGVNDPACRQTEAGGDARLTARATAETTAVLLQPRTGSAMNCAIDATPAQQRRVGGVHNGVHMEQGNVLLNHLEHRFSPIGIAYAQYLYAY